LILRPLKGPSTGLKAYLPKGPRKWGLMAKDIDRLQEMLLKKVALENTLSTQLDTVSDWISTRCHISPNIVEIY